MLFGENTYADFPEYAYMEQFRENPTEKLPTSTFYNYLLNLC